MIKNILTGLVAVVIAASLLWATEYPPSSTFDGIVTNTGTFAVQEDGAALTALQIIDDMVAPRITTTHQTIVLTAGDDSAASSVIAVDGYGMASIAVAATSGFTGAANVNMEVSFDNGLTFIQPSMIDNFNDREHISALDIVDNDTATALVPLTGVTDIRTRLTDTSGDNSTITISSVVFDQPFDETMFTIRSVGDLYVNARGARGILGLMIQDPTPVAPIATGTLALVPPMQDAFGGMYVRLLGTDGAAFDPSLNVFAEDTMHSTGALGIFSLAIRNENEATFTGTELDYTGFAVDRSGRQMSVPMLSPLMGDANQIGKGEDAIHSTGDGGIAAWSVRDDTPVASSAALTGRYATLATDDFGGLYVRLLGTGGAAFDASTLLLDATLTTIFGADAIFGTAGSSDTDVLTVQGIAAMTPLITQPFDAVVEQGLTELVGINELLAQNNYSDEVTLTLASTSSGEVLKVCLYTTEDATGAILEPTGTLFLFDADPSVTLNDTDLTAAARVTMIAQIPVAAGDWDSDANGAVACLTRADAFHDLASVFAVWRHTLATSINSAAGDDEQLEANLWYRRDS